MSGMSGSPTPGMTGSSDGAGGKRDEISTYEVLRYIRSTFDDDTVLDICRVHVCRERCDEGMEDIGREGYERWEERVGWWEGDLET